MNKSTLMGNEQVDKSLNIIKNAIDIIYQEEASTLSFEELYRNSYTLSINKHGKKLYKEISESIKRCILTYIK
jgi:cullin 3